MATYKIVLVGDGQSGKTTFVTQCLSGHFQPLYVSTLGVEVYPLHAKTNVGDTTLNFWDTAGQERYGGLRDGYYLQSHVGLIFADDPSNIPLWYSDLRKTCGNIPIFVVQSKRDSIKTNHVEDYCTRHGLPYLPVSAKDGNTCRDALLKLLKRLNPEVTWVSY